MRHLLSRAHAGLRRLALCSLLFTAPAFAGPGGPDHQHGPEPTATTLPQSPRLVAVSEAWQLVGILKGGALTLYLDRQDDNAPASGATLDLDIAGRTVRAEPQPDGTFRIPAEALGTGEVEVLATIGGAAPDLLVINKTDLAPLVGADLGVMDRDARRMRGSRPFIFTNLKKEEGVAEIARFVLAQGGIAR